MSVFQLGNLRVVDLTKVLDPATESRRCHLTRFNTGGPIPDFHTIMDLTSHLGTHCECPYHHDDNWPSVADLPLTTFLGRAIYVDFKDTVAPRAHITAADLDRATAGKIQDGDIVIIDSSIENSNEDVKPFHDILMAENIVFLEVLQNLEELKSDVFFMSYSPLPIKGLDSCPIRAYAIEGLAEFS